MMADQNIRIVAFKKYRLRHSGISSEIIALKIEISKQNTVSTFYKKTGLFSYYFYSFQT